MYSCRPTTTKRHKEKKLDIKTVKCRQYPPSAQDSEKCRSKNGYKRYDTKHLLKKNPREQSKSNPDLSKWLGGKETGFKSDCTSDSEIVYDGQYLETETEKEKYRYGYQKPEREFKDDYSILNRERYRRMRLDTYHY